jgi:hypothetical protein
VTYVNLTGDATAAHIHGGAGVAAPIVVDLAPSGIQNPIKGVTTLSDAQVADLEAGKAYVNIHTVQNKGGEICGQQPMRACAAPDLTSSPRRRQAIRAAMDDLSAPHALFRAWCAGAGSTALRATTATVIRFIRSLGPKRDSASIAHYLHSIARWHSAGAPRRRCRGSAGANSRTQTHGVLSRQLSYARGRSFSRPRASPA